MSPPSFLALVLMLLIGFFDGISAQTDSVDQGVLATFYSSLTSTGVWSWDSTTDACTTGGWVTCTGTAPNMKIQQIDLNTNQLAGTIPTQFGELTSLQYLDLETNQLAGPLPTQLGLLTSLQYLNLGVNDFEGGIPTQLSFLINLQYLNLGTNDLTGTVPTQLGLLTSLTNLFFDTQELSGTIPTQLCSLTSLQYLFTHNNLLIGTIPSCLGSLSSLKNILFSVNCFSPVADYSSWADYSDYNSYTTNPLCAPPIFSGSAYSPSSITSIPTASHPRHNCLISNGVINDGGFTIATSDGTDYCCRFQGIIQGGLCGTNKCSLGFVAQAVSTYFENDDLSHCFALCYTQGSGTTSVPIFQGNQYKPSSPVSLSATVTGGLDCLISTTSVNDAGYLVTDASNNQYCCRFQGSYSFGECLHQVCGAPQPWGSPAIFYDPSNTCYGQCFL